MKEHTIESCAKANLAIRDTLDIVGGKWKLIVSSVLRSGRKGLNELSREAGSTPRILSKELQELEMNGVLSRKLCDTKPVTVQYEWTEYSHSLNDVLVAMEKWGYQHRKRIVQGIE